MKLVGLILAGLCTGFVSGGSLKGRQSFDPFNRFGYDYDYFGFPDWRNHLPKDSLNSQCEEIYKDYSLERVMEFTPFIRFNILKFCAKFYFGESSKHVSTEVPRSTKSDSTSVLVSLSEIRNQKLLNSFRSEGNIAKYAHSDTSDDLSTETSPSLKRNVDGTNPKNSEDFNSKESSKESGLITEITNSNTSNDVTIEISKETVGTIGISTPEVSDDSSLTQKSNATKKSTDITYTSISDGLSEEISVATDEIKETPNSTAPDAHTSDETSGVTADVEHSTSPDKKESTEPSSKLTDRTSDANYSGSPSTTITTISKGASDETTPVTDSLDTSSETVGTSESTSSETSESTISSKTTTTSDEFQSTTSKNTVSVSTDYSTSEKTKSEIVSESTSTTVPSSSSVRPNIVSTTRLYSTERASTVTPSSWSQKTTHGDTETPHSITTIELPATRTLKLAVSITFLVIALISLVVLVVYFIATRRRTFSYDELLLMP